MLTSSRYNNTIREMRNFQSASRLPRFVGTDIVRKCNRESTLIYPCCRLRTAVAIHVFEIESGHPMLAEDASPYSS
jgi:hypothetical protein